MYVRNINFGFDSCSCNKFIESIKDIDKDTYNKLSMCAEPCESGNFSSYISAEGIYYPCSFCEDIERGIDVKSISNFTKDVWYSEEVVKFRNNLLSNKDKNGFRKCPVFNV